MGKRFLGREPASKTVSHYHSDFSRFTRFCLFWPIVIELSPGPIFYFVDSKLNTKRNKTTH